MRLLPFDCRAAFRRARFVPLVLTALLFAPLALRAQWTGALSGGGVDAIHDYNTATNWNGSAINDSFAGVFLNGPLGINLSANRTTGASGLNLLTNSFGFAMTLQSNGTANYTLTLAGGVQSQDTKTIGSATANLGVNFDFGGATRTFNVAGSLTLLNTISNGGITKTGTGTLTLDGAVTHTVSTATVSGGTLALNNAGATLSGTAVTVNNPTAGTTANFNLSAGSLTGSLILESGGATAISAATISGTGAFTTAAAASIGNTAGSNAQLTLSGASASWTTTGSNTATTVGGAGTGSVTINSGAQMTVRTLNIGNTGGTGAVTITGANSRLTVGGPLFQLGGGGTGTINVDNGGTLNTSGSGLFLGNGGTGTLTVANASTWTDGGTWMAPNGTGSATISGASTVTAGQLRIGGAVGSAGTFTVAGAGTTYTVTSTNTTTGVVIGNSVGTGTLTLTTGAVFNAGTGGVTILNLAPSAGGTGTLNIGSGAAPGTLNAAAVAIGGGTGTIAFNHTDGTGTYVFAPPITGTSGTVTFGGGGTTVLTGANTFTGTTTVASGTTMQVGNGGTTGTWAGDVVNNSVLSFNRSDSLTYAGAITGTGTLHKDGTGTLTLSGTSTFGDGIQLNSGTLVVTGAATSLGDATNVNAGSTLRIGAGGTTGSHAGLIRNFSAVIFDRSDAVTHAGVISNTGTVTQAGSGTLTLTGANTYTGATTVNAGTLILAGTFSGATLFNVADGGTLGGAGNYGPTATINLGGRVSPGTGTSIATLGFNNGITWNGSNDGSATMLFHLSNTDATSDRLTTGGNFNKGTGSTFRFDFQGTGQVGRTYTLVQSLSATFAASDLSFTNLAPGVTGTFAVSFNGNVTFTTTLANASPVATASGGATAFTENGAALAIDTGLTVTDSDNANLAGATVSITANFAAAQDTLAFTNANGITGSYVAGTGVLTLTGSATLANYQAALRSVTYVNNSENPSAAARTMSFIVNDGTSNSTAGTKSVTVAVVNDAPVVTGPANLAGTEDAVMALTGISFTDADAGASSVVATFTVPSGTLAAIAGGGVTVGGTSTALTLTGTVANLNAFIAASNLAYTPAADASGNVTLTTSLNDGGNTGSGGAQTGSATTTLAIAAVNDAPTITAPAMIAGSEDVPLALTSISFADVDAGSASLSVSFTVPSGALTGPGGNILVGPNTGGVTAAAGSGTTSRTLTGTIANLNAYLAAGNLLYTSAANASGNVNLALSIGDAGNTGSGGALTGNANVTLAIVAVNDAPVNTLPATQSVLQNNTLTLSTGNSNKLSIADVDATGPGPNVSVTLFATNGTFSLSGTAGLAFTVGGGTADAAMTVIGPLAAINLALDGLVFTPTIAFAGAATLQIATSDQGNTGSGGALTDIDTLTINVLTPTSVAGTMTVAGNFAPGGTVTYTVTLTNSGTIAQADNPGNEFTDVLPASLTLVSATAGSGTAVATVGTNTVTWNGGIGASGSATITVTATVNASATGTISNQGTISFDSDNNGTNETSAVTDDPGVAGASDPTNFTTSPVVTAVTATTADGTYKLGDTVAITLTFDQAVTVVTTGGTPTLLLETGATDRTAAYASGSGTATLTFNYTVQTGDTSADLDAVSTSSLALNGGTIRSAGSLDARLTLATPGTAGSLGANKALVVDGVAPSVVISAPSVLSTVSGPITYTVTYADTNFAASTLINANVTLNTTGTATGTVAVTGAGTTRTVTIAGVGGTGSLSISLAAGTASDSAGNLALAAGPSASVSVAPPPPPPTIVAQIVTFAPVSVQLGSSVTLNATASSGLPVTFSMVSGNGTLTGATFTPADLAPVTLRASQAGNSAYAAAFAEQTITPSGKFPQSVVFAAPADRAATAPAFTLNATASSGLTVGYAIVSGPAMLSGNTITLTGAPGTVVITASQNGSATFEAAASVTRSFNVTPIAVFVFFGATNTGDDVAATLTLDRTSGRVIGYLRATGESFVLPFAPVAGSPGVYSGRGTLFPSTALPHPFTATLRANTNGDVLTGSVDGNPLTFSITIQSQVGPNAAVAGGYHAPLLNTASGETHAVVSAPGRVYWLAATPGLTGGGFGTLDASHTFSVTTTPTSTVAGAIDPASTIVTGIYTPPGKAASAFAGLNIATTRTDRLVNLSSRDRVGAGPRTLIAGFVIAGEGLKSVLIRASGPALNQFGLTGTLPNPALLLHRDGRVVHDNDDWSQSPNPADITSNGARIGAFALGAASRDAAISDSLAPGAYTAQVLDQGGTGVALAEIYDAALNPSSEYQRLINISSRGESSPGDGVLVGGFTITGNFPKRVLIRGIGPTLGAFGVPGTLTDPNVKVFNRLGVLIGQNEDWETPTPVNAVQSAATTAEINAAAAQSGAFGLTSGAKDSTVILTLAPGAYTAHVASATGQTGVALVEIYEIPQ